MSKSGSTPTATPAALEKEINSHLVAALSSIMIARAKLREVSDCHMDEDLRQAERDVADMVAWSALNPNWSTAPIS